eukprot:3451432-Amphidinium_carterae.2
MCLSAGLNAAAVGLLVPTIFIAYDTLQDRSPFKAGSRTMAVVAYCAVEVPRLQTSEYHPLGRL